MFFNSSLLTPLAKHPTDHLTAWRDEYYETYRLNFEIPAVRLHPRNRPGGRWFAVDTHDIGVRQYQGLMAIVDKHGDPTFFRGPVLDWCLLLPRTIVNVGVAAEQGFHEGGGLQFEFRQGEPAQVLDKDLARKRVRM
jgi:hypothetical protein